MQTEIAMAGGPTMNIPVLLEPIENNGYRASSGAPLTLTAEGATRDEALNRLRDQLVKRLQKGAELVAIDLGTSKNPWLAMAGIYDSADPLVQEWKQAMAEYRQKIDNDPDFQ
jgi:hypothetical protein